jgi:hypothetical protein
MTVGACTECFQNILCFVTLVCGASGGDTILISKLIGWGLPTSYSLFLTLYPKKTLLVDIFFEPTLTGENPKYKGIDIAWDMAEQFCVVVLYKYLTFLHGCFVQKNNYF